jgi:hypothetical protein
VNAQQAKKPSWKPSSKRPPRVKNANQHFRRGLDGMACAALRRN